MIGWIKTVQGIAPIVAVIFATWWNLGLPRVVFSRPSWLRSHAQIEALERFNRDTRLLVLDQTLVARPSPRYALAGDGCGVRDVGWQWRRPAGRRAAARGRHSGVE